MLVDLTRFRIDEISRVSREPGRGRSLSAFADDLHHRLTYASRYPEMVLYTLFLDTTELHPLNASRLEYELPVTAHEVASLHSLNALLAEQRGLSVGQWIGYRYSSVDAHLVRSLSTSKSFRGRPLTWLARDVAACREILLQSKDVERLSTSAREAVLALIDGWEGSIGELVAVGERL